MALRDAEAMGEIGNAVFIRFIVGFNRIMEKQGFTDDIAYGEDFKPLLMECVKKGWSAYRVYDLLFMLQDAGLVDLQPYRVRALFG